MTEISVIELFGIKKTKLRLPLPWEERVLEGESAIVLFHDIALKKQFYDQLHAEKGSLIVFDCGAGFMETIEIKDGQVLKISDFDDLLRQMERIMTDPDEEMAERHMNTLVIENISTFYWALRRSKQRTQRYVKLRDLVEKLKDWFQCNVIVTSWDCEFEKGFNSKQQVENPEALKDLTYIPVEFYTKFDHIFALGRQNYRYKDKWLLCT